MLDENAMICPYPPEIVDGDEILGQCGGGCYRVFGKKKTAIDVESIEPNRVSNDIERDRQPEGDAEHKTKIIQG